MALKSGTTAHARFKLPIVIEDGAVCNIQAGSAEAKRLLMADLIILDEVCSFDARYLKSIDKTLKDITKNKEQPFGGLSFVFAGDARQRLPIVPGFTEVETRGFTFAYSELSRECRKSSLTHIFRQGNEKEWAQFVLDVGENKIKPIKINDDGREIFPVIELPVKQAHDVNDLIRFAYPYIFHNKTSDESDDDFDDIRECIKTSIILSPHLKNVEEINMAVQSIRTGRVVGVDTFYSTDTAIHHADGMKMDLDPTVLNKLTFKGVPPHELSFRKGDIIMITRNLNQKEKTVNGMRGIYKRKISPYAIEVEIPNGPKGEWNTVIIPRINFKIEAGVHIFRKQFPLTAAYSTSIDKAQGMTLSRVAIDLRSSPFSHGQLYVAIGRARSQFGIMVLSKYESVGNQIVTENPVDSIYLDVALGAARAGAATGAGAAGAARARAAGAARARAGAARAGAAGAARAGAARAGTCKRVRRDDGETHIRPFPWHNGNSCHIDVTLEIAFRLSQLFPEFPDIKPYMPGYFMTLNDLFQLRRTHTHSDEQYLHDYRQLLDRSIQELGVTMRSALTPNTDARGFGGVIDNATSLLNNSIPEVWRARLVCQRCQNIVDRPIEMNLTLTSLNACHDHILHAFEWMTNRIGCRACTRQAAAQCRRAPKIILTHIPPEKQNTVLRGIEGGEIFGTRYTPMGLVYHKNMNHWVCSLNFEGEWITIDGIRGGSMMGIPRGDEFTLTDIVYLAQEPATAGAAA